MAIDLNAAWALVRPQYVFQVEEYTQTGYYFCRLCPAVVEVQMLRWARKQDILAFCAAHLKVSHGVTVDDLHEWESLVEEAATTEQGGETAM